MKIFTFTVLLLLVCACTNKTQMDENSKANHPSESAIVETNDLDKLMSDIDLQLSILARVESLTYHKEDGSSMSATAYLDQNNVITKIEEERVDVAAKERARYAYYSNGGVLFASRKMSEKVKDEKAYFSEEITFYSPDGKPKSTKERTSDFEEYIDQSAFHAVNKVAHSNDRALRVLKQEGEFLTTFQGFVESGPYHFLIVGENVSGDGFTASLSIQEDSNTIRYLRKEGARALGKELKVEFEKLLDSQNYMIQILKSVALVERR